MANKGPLGRVLNIAVNGIDSTDMAKKAKQKYNDLNRKAPNSYRSIAQATSDLIATFPVLCTNSISAESAMMIAKAIERKATTMLQLVFASTNMNSAENGIEYLKQFHNNIHFGGSLPNVDEWIHMLYNASNDVIGSYGESGELGSEEFVQAILSEDGVSVSTEAARHLVELMKNDTVVLPDSINEHSVSDFKISESKYGYRISINPIHEEHDFESPNPRDSKYKPRGMSDKEWRKTGYALDYEKQRLYDTDYRNYTYLKDKYRDETDREKDERSKRKDRLDMEGKDVDIEAKKAAITKGEADMISKQLVPTDVKKANELVPSLLIVRFTNKDTGIVTPFLIGVKAKLVLCSSFEIIDRINRKNKDNVGIVKLIRSTTGELSFWKDFVLGIKDAKIDALSKNNRGSNIEAWRILERLAYQSSKNVIKGTANDASAIATVVISQEEVEYLMKQHNMDMMNRAVTYSVMDAYNLLCFVIVDESSEVAHFMFNDKHGMFEDIPFSALERDAGDGMYKKVINLMSKIR